MIIKNARIYTAEDKKWIDGDIAIENGKIKEIGENLTGEEVIDAEGRIVTPGFIESHCHIGLDEEGMRFEGMDFNEIVDPVSPELRAIDAINPRDIAFKEAIEGGVTTAMTGPGSANVIGGTFCILKLFGDRVDDMVINENAAMKVAFGENPKFCYNDLQKSPMTRMATAAILRNALFQAKRYMEKKETAEDIKDMPDYDMRYEALIPVLKREIPLKAHAHRADDIFTSIRIAKEFNLKLTLDHCTEGHLIAEKLSKENYPALIGPTFGNRSKVELMNKSFITPKIINEAGILFSIITDSPVIPLHHLPLAAGLAHKSGLPYEDALDAITINPAKIIGEDKRIGSIKVGKDADIVIHNGDPILDVASTVAYTIIDGRVVYKRD